MPTKTEKTLQQLKKNYGNVQSKLYDIETAKEKTEKSFLSDTKKYQTVLTKDLRENTQKASKNKKELRDNLSLEKKENKDELQVIKMESSDVKANYNETIKELKKVYDIEVKEVKLQTKKAETTFKSKFASLEMQYKEDIDTSNQVRSEVREDVAKRLKEVNQKLEVVDSKHQTKIEKLVENFTIKRNDLEQKHLTRINQLEDEKNQYSVNREAKYKQLQENCQNKINEKNNEIDKVNQIHQKRLDQLVSTYNNKFERQDKFIKKYKEDNDLKSVKERQKEIKKLQNEKERNHKNIIREYDNTIKTLTDEKKAIEQENVSLKSDFLIETAKESEALLSKVEIAKIECDKELSKADANHKKALQKEVKRFNNEFESLEKELALIIKEDSDVIVTEDKKVKKIEYLFTIQKDVLENEKNKALIQNDFKLKELELTYLYNLDVEKQTYETKIEQLQAKADLISNKQVLSEKELLQKTEIIQHQLLFDNQVKNSEEYIRFQNAFAIMDSEHINQEFEYELAELENRYDLEINRLEDILSSLDKKYEILSKKNDAFYHKEVKVYQDIITSLTKTDMTNFETYKQEKEAALQILIDEKESLPKRGNFFKIRKLQKKIEKQKTLVKQDLLHKEEEIKQTAKEYYDEIEKATSRYEKAKEEVDNYISSIKEQYNLKVAFLTSSKQDEIDFITTKKSNALTAIKEFDLASKNRFEQAKDENQQYFVQKKLPHEQQLQVIENEIENLTETYEETRRKREEEYQNTVETMKTNFDMTLQPLRDEMIASVTAINESINNASLLEKEKQEQIDKTAVELLHDNEKEYLESIDQIKGEIASRDVMIRVKKSEIEDFIKNYKREYEEKTKRQQLKSQERLQEELSKINSMMTSTLSKMK